MLVRRRTRRTQPRQPARARLGLDADLRPWASLPSGPPFRGGRAGPPAVAIGIIQISKGGKPTGGRGHEDVLELLRRAELEEDVDFLREGVRALA